MGWTEDTRSIVTESRPNVDDDETLARQLADESLARQLAEKEMQKAATRNAKDEAEKRDREMAMKLEASYRQADSDERRRPDIKFQWMWADAGMLGLHRFAEINPVRWSNLHPADVLAQEIQNWVDD